MAALPVQLLERIEKEAGTEYLPIVGREKAEFLFRLVEEGRSCRVLEVGVLTGYATAAMAAALGEGCKLIGIEINRELAERAESNLVAAGLDQNVELHRGDAREVIAELEGEFDLVVLDAQKSQYLGSLRMLEPKLAPGAVVVANGVGEQDKSLADYLEHVRNSERWQTKTESFGNSSLEVSRWRG